MLYEAYLQCCNERRFDELREYVAHDVVVDAEPVGLDDYVARLRDLVDAFHDCRWQLQHVVKEPPWLAVHLFVSGAHTGTRWGIPATGRRITSQEFALYRIVNDKIVEVWDTADDLRIVDQLRAGPDEAGSCLSR